MNMQNKLYAI